MTITEFLLARIDEDEEAARFVRADSPAEVDGHTTYYGTPASQDPNRLVLAVDYQRVLAECEAKRRIVADRPLPIGHFWDGQRAQHDNALRFLASVYADHPDYRDEWRV